MPAVSLPNKRTVATVLSLILWGGITGARGEADGEAPKSPTAAFLEKRGYSFPPPNAPKAAPGPEEKWPKIVYYNTEYKARLLGSPTIPYSFAKIERNNGQFQVSPVISAGLGYAFFFGDFIFHETDKIAIDQNFAFGAVALFGVQNNFNLNKLASIVTAGFVGLGPVALYFGFDYLTQSFSLEFGQRIDFSTLSQNFLNPIGRVRPTRPPKPTAIPIAND